jgi:tRNA-Thr(GGU) m(6)t(6)A37 methyltransferase TsaA
MQKKITYELRSIGTIEAANGEFAVRVYEDYKEALKEIEGFSHLFLFWWCHFLDNREMRKYTVAPKPYKQGPDEIGLFATRSPVRPNPLAVTIFPLIDVDQDEGLLRVAYVDAENGSPVIDIKPYYGIDRVRDVTVPSWCGHWPSWYEDAAIFDWEGEFENAM